MRGDSKQNRRFSDKESNLSEKANEIQKKKWKIVSYVTNLKSTGVHNGMGLEGWFGVVGVV